MNQFFTNFQRAAINRGYEEDDAQGAIVLVMERQGKEFFDGSKGRLMLFLISALREARRRNNPRFRPANKGKTFESIDDVVIDLVVKTKVDYTLELDKLVSRAKLTHQQSQDFHLFLRGFSYKAIGDICNRPYQSVQQSVAAVRDKCIAIRVGALV